jgi:hypothetical protein
LQFPLRAFWKKFVFVVLQTDNGKIAGKDIKKTVIRRMLWVSVMTVSMATDITRTLQSSMHSMIVRLACAGA